MTTHCLAWSANFASSDLSDVEALLGNPALLVGARESCEVCRAHFGPGLRPGPRRQARRVGRGLQGQWRAAGASARSADYIERSYIYDLGGSAPELASTVSVEAVLQDAVDLARPEVLRAAGQVTCPVVLVRAPLGFFNEEPPGYPDPAVAAGRRLVPQLADVLVPGVNHYTIMLSRTWRRSRRGRDPPALADAADVIAQVISSAR